MFMVFEFAVFLHHVLCIVRGLHFHIFCSFWCCVFFSFPYSLRSLPLYFLFVVGCVNLRRLGRHSVCAICVLICFVCCRVAHCVCELL